MFGECVYVCVWLLLLLWDRISLYGPDWPGTHFVVPVGLQLRDKPASASASWVVGLKVFTTVLEFLLLWRDTMTTATLIENISLGLAYRFVIMLGSMTALRQTWCRRVLQLDPHAAGDCVPLLCIGHPDQSDPLPPAKPHLTEPLPHGPMGANYKLPQPRSRTWLSF